MNNAHIPPKGTFPFPLPSAESKEQESAYVTWIRNHSNYLTVGTLAAKTGSLAAFLWGTFINALLLAPTWLVAAILIGYSHFSMLESPAWWLLCLTFLFGPIIGIVLWQRGRETEKSRSKGKFGVVDVISRLVGCLILGSIIAAVVIAVPFVVEAGRDYLRRTEFKWASVATSIIGIIVSTVGFQWRSGQSDSAIDSGIKKPSLKKSVIPILLAIIGIASLYAILILVENFVVFGNPLALMWPWMMKYFSEPWLYVLIAIASLVCMLLACVIWGVPRSFRNLFVPVLTVYVPLAVLYFYAAHCPEERARRDQEGARLAIMHEKVGEITRPLTPLANTPLDQVVIPDSMREIVTRLSDRKRKLDEYYDIRPVTHESIDSNEKCLDDWAVAYFGLAQAYGDEGCDLLDENVVDLKLLKGIIAEVDRLGLAAIIKERLREQRHQLAIISSVEGNNEKQERDSGLAPPRKDMITTSPEAAKQFQASLVRLLAWRLLSTDRAGAFLPASISDLYDAEILSSLSHKLEAELLKIRANARHEAELARLLHREADLASDLFLRRNTIAAKGTLHLIGRDYSENDFHALLQEAIVHRKYRDVPDSEALLRLQELDRLPEQDLKTAAVLAMLQNRFSDLKPRTLRWVAEKPRRVRIGYEERDVDGNDIREIGSVAGRYHAGDDLMARAAKRVLFEMALGVSDRGEEMLPETAEAGSIEAARELGLISVPGLEGIRDPEHRISLYSVPVADGFTNEEIADAAMAKFAMNLDEASFLQAADRVTLAVANGAAGDFRLIGEIRRDLAANTFPVKLRLIFSLVAVLGAFCFCIADINASSMHGYYRNQLARAFFLRSRNGTIEPDKAVRLSELREAGSTAPYTIINAALNMQASRDPSLRDRKSDFFVFTKRYCGGDKTTYVETKQLERVYPHISLSTAMAVSAAAVAPNMGRNTNGFLVFLMTLFNARLGYWVPSPKMLKGGGKAFGAVFAEELEKEIWPRRRQEYGPDHQRASKPVCLGPTSENDLVGLAFSGGGIRSAAVNLGISQKLHQSGILRHVDYLSTVSGGGYTGSSMAVAMRHRGLEQGTATTADMQQNRVSDSPMKLSWYRKRLGRWRLPEFFFAKELISCLHEAGSWVNLSDGGHIENLAAIELLRRRCKFVIIGDAEADPDHMFNGVGTLIRLARLELGVEININLNPLRLSDGKSPAHFAIGKVHYPGSVGEDGYLLYLKSSLSGDENELIKEYGSRCRGFPHEATLDQFFDIGQFEAYRSLGEHVAESAVQSLNANMRPSEDMDLGSFTPFKEAFIRLAISTPTVTGDASAAD